MTETVDRDLLGFESAPSAPCSRGPSRFARMAAVVPPTETEAENVVRGPWTVTASSVLDGAAMARVRA